MQGLFIHILAPEAKILFHKFWNPPFIPKEFCNHLHPKMNSYPVFSIMGDIFFIVIPVRFKLELLDGLTSARLYLFVYISLFYILTWLFDFCGDLFFRVLF